MFLNFLEKYVTIKKGIFLMTGITCTGNSNSIENVYSWTMIIAYQYIHI